MFTEREREELLSVIEPVIEKAFEEINDSIKLQEHENVRGNQDIAKYLR